MATSYVSWEDLERSFVMRFTLGHPKDRVYVVSVGNITDTLFFVLDYGNDGLNYFCTRVVTHCPFLVKIPSQLLRRHCTIKPLSHCTICLWPLYKRAHRAIVSSIQAHRDNVSSLQRILPSCVHA